MGCDAQAFTASTWCEVRQALKLGGKVRDFPFIACDRRTNPLNHSPLKAWLIVGILHESVTMQRKESCCDDKRVFSLDANHLIIETAVAKRR